MTNNLERRINEHKYGIGSEFTSKYNLNKLLWFEVFSSPMDAIMREKQLKNWKRKWKEDLINSSNPNWIDLSEEI